MKDVREVYPDAQEYGFSASDYTPLLDSFGYERVLRVDENGYQGDSWVLYKDGSKYGYLEFGWGSCSGCDSLQACGTYEEVAALQQSLHNDIEWFDTAADALEWFKTHDWEGDYSWGAPELKRFVAAVIDLLQLEAK